LPNRQHSQQRHRAPEGIRGRLAKLRRYESYEAIEPAKPMPIFDGQTVIGKELSWVALRNGSSIPHVTFLCMDRLAGVLSRGDDPFNRGLLRQHPVS
jgi:hypothetical protein